MGGGVARCCCCGGRNADVDCKEQHENVATANIENRMIVLLYFYYLLPSSNIIVAYL